MLRVWHPGSHLSFQSRNVDTGHTLDPSLTKQATEVVMIDYSAWMADLKIMANSFPVCLKWPKNTFIEWLCKVCGVGWESEDDDTVFRC